MFKMPTEKQREYIYKLKVYRSDYDTRRNNLARLEEKYNSKFNLNKLTTNNGKGISKDDAKKIEREAVLDINNKVDYQQQLLNDIGRDLTNAHSNLTGVVTEVKAQGETINRIQTSVKDTEVVVKRTDTNISTMQTRVFCQKCLLHLLAIVLFLGILAAIFYKLFK